MASEPATKFAKLNKIDDYVQWKRRVTYLIMDKDPNLVGLKAKPTSEENQAIWSKWNAIAKSAIFMHLGDSAMAKIGQLIDDHSSTAYDLSKALEGIYTTSNSQAVQNLMHKLDTHIFAEGGNWAKHVSKFLELTGQLAAVDAALSEKEQSTKLIRSLPPSFSPFAMVNNVVATSFNQLVDAVQAEISRRSNPHNPHTTKTPQAHFTTPQNEGGRRRDSGRGRGSRLRNRDSSHGINKRKNGLCIYCHKKSHYQNECRDSRTKGVANGQGVGPPVLVILYNQTAATQVLHDGTLVQVPSRPKPLKVKPTS